MLQGLSPRLILALAAFVAFLPVPFAAGAQLNSAARGNPAAGARRVSQADSALAAHVLSRLTFGPRPGDIGRLLQTGIDRWIDGQLRPESIVDSSGARALEGCSAWTDPVEGVVASLSGSISVGTMMRPSDGRMVRTSVSIIGVPSLIMRDSARRNERTGPALLEMGQLIACRLARVEASDQQLVEVLTDFWANHFSINSARVPSRGALVEWDRAVIRPRALGRFRDLLGAVARSPAMLAYLDNAVSSADSSHPTLEEVVQARAVGAAPVVGARRGGLNENYARELLELHTLGVDGGYTQTDVIEVARALTGWTHSLAPTNREQRFLAARPGVPAVFRFDSAAHDAGAKHVLGHALPAGRGIEDGDEVLDILARHTSTARFVARKLAVRLVSDAPPEALVERAAATFARTDGDIREVVRTIVTSPEFLSPDVYRAKVKSPLELVLSIRRALAAPPDTAAETIDLLLALDQPPFGYPAPDGWPETGPPWLTASAFRVRVDLAVRISQGEVPSILVESWPGWRATSGESFDAQMDGVIRAILSGQVSPETRAVMRTAAPTRGDPDTPEARQRVLRELIAMALSSPEFQRR